MPAAPRLHELQQGFAAAVMGRDHAVATWVVGAGLEPAARLSIYANSGAATLTAALRDSYPGVLALVGEDFFDAMAARYRQQHPSVCGNLQHFGAALAGFIAGMPEAGALRYLEDVARLDWRRQLAALAADATPVDAISTAEVVAVATEKLRIQLHPSVQMLRSDYAVMTLWQWCQAPSDAPPRVDEGEQVLLWRHASDVAMAALDPATFRWIEMLADGHDVAAAWACARELDNTFDLESCLRDLLGHGLVVAFTDEEIAP
jgi:hypothetical protein